MVLSRSAARAAVPSSSAVRIGYLCGQIGVPLVTTLADQRDRIESLSVGLASVRGGLVEHRERSLRYLMLHSKR
jgi:hypothetical protein